MTSPIQAQHDAQLKKIADRLQKEGYDVILEPGPGDLPFDLGGYRPDLLARRGQESVLIELKVRADRLSFDTLRSVAEEVKRHQGWRFLLITSQDISDSDLLADEHRRVTWNEIAERVEHAQALLAQGDQEAAYVVMWIAFERMLRLQATQVSLPLERLSPSIVIRQLYSAGELTMEQFDVALSCQDVRNRVVHGLPAPDLETALDRLSRLVRELLSEWATPSSAT